MEQCVINPFYGSPFSAPLHTGYVGVDSGGSLSKLVYFRPVTTTELPDYVLQDKVLPPSLPGLQPDISLDLDCMSPWPYCSVGAIVRTI